MGYSRRAAVGQLSGKRHIFVVGMEHIKPSIEDGSRLYRREEPKKTELCSVETDDQVWLL